MSAPKFFSAVLLVRAVHMCGGQSPSPSTTGGSSSATTETVGTLAENNGQCDERSDCKCDEDWFGAQFCKTELAKVVFKVAPYNLDAKSIFCAQQVRPPLNPKFLFLPLGLCAKNWMFVFVSHSLAGMTQPWFERCCFAHSPGFVRPNAMMHWYN
jgi:hypothetical protein